MYLMLACLYSDCYKTLIMVRERYEYVRAGVKQSTVGSVWCSTVVLTLNVVRSRCSAGTSTTAFVHIISLHVHNHKLLKLYAVDSDKKM